LRGTERRSNLKRSLDKSLQSLGDCHARLRQARNDKKEGNFRKTKLLRFQRDYALSRRYVEHYEKISDLWKTSLIKNSDVLEQFEREMIKKEKLSFEQALNLFEALWQEGVDLGVLPPEDPLEGIDVDIQVARILNCLKEF